MHNKNGRLLALETFKREYTKALDDEQRNWAWATLRRKVMNEGFVQFLNVDGRQDPEGMQRGDIVRLQGSHTIFPDHIVKAYDGEQILLVRPHCRLSEKTYGQLMVGFEEVAIYFSEQSKYILVRR